MNRWAKVLRAVCEEAKEERVELFILEGDSELNWYGAGLSELCQEVEPTSEDAPLYRKVKSKISDKVGGGGFIAYVSPVNFQVDIYESDRRRFPSSSESSRPFSVTRDGFRVGFFSNREEAVDFFLRVGKRLREEGINLHLFY